MSCQKSQIRIQDFELIRKISSTVVSYEIILIRSMTVVSLTVQSVVLSSAPVKCKPYSNPVTLTAMSK